MYFAFTVDVKMYLDIVLLIDAPLVLKISTSI